MLKAFPRYAIGTAILLSGCQSVTPSWMAAWKQPSDAASAAEKEAPKKTSLTSAFSKKPNEASATAASTGVKKGTDQLTEYCNAAAPRAQLLEEAEKNFERALLVDPKNAEAHHGLGVCLDLQKRYPGAEEHYKRAIAIDSRNATYVADLGYSYFLQGRYAEAEKALSGSLILDPNNKQAARNLGVTYAKQGKRELAESTFRRVMNDGEVRQAMAQFEGGGADIALASGEQPKPAREGSWDNIQSQMDTARQESLRQRQQRTQQSRASELGLDPERLRQMEMLQRQQGMAGGGGGQAPVDPRANPRDYRGRDPYADMKNQLETLDRQRTNVANGPVYLDQSGFQSSPHQSATFPEAQQTYHPEGAIQPLSGNHVPANSSTWAPGAYSPHAAPQGGLNGQPPQGGFNGQPPQGGYSGQPSQGGFSGQPAQGGSLVPPQGASPYYQQPPAGYPAGGGQEPSIPPQYQTGYGPQSQNASPIGSGQNVQNAFGNRGAASALAMQAQGQPRAGGISTPPGQGYGPQGYPNGIQQAAAENVPPNAAFDPAAFGVPAGVNPALLLPSGGAGGGMNPAAFAAGHDPRAAAAFGGQQGPGPGAGQPSFGSDFEQAKREAAMHGLGVGPGPLFPSQNPGSQQAAQQPSGPMPNFPGLPPQAGMGGGGQMAMPSGMSLPGGMTQPPAYGNLPGLPPQAGMGGGNGPQPGDGVQIPGVQWNGAQSAPIGRQLPTDIQAPDLRKAMQPQYESTWDLYRSQTNQLGQQTPAAGGTYRTQGQYSANSGFTGQQPGTAPINLPTTTGLENYDDARGRLAQMNQQQQAILLQSPSNATHSAATEARSAMPIIPPPSDLMTPTWGNQSVIPPAWPSRQAGDADYRVRGYDQNQDSMPQYERGDANRGVVTPDRYPSANSSSSQRVPNYPSASGGNSQSNAGYPNGASGNGLPAIVPGTRNGY